MKSHVKVMLLVCQLYLLIFLSSGAFKGAEGRRGEFNYQVVIKKDSKPICGGSIISDKHVLTAVRCFLHFEHKLLGFTVVVEGSHLGLKKDIELGIKSLQTPITTVNPSKNYNIAIVELTESLNLYLNRLSRKLSLPKKNDRTATFATVFHHEKNNLYQLKVQTDNYCTNKTSTSINNINIKPSRLICGYVVQNGKSCHGDFGSGLVAGNKVIGVLVSPSLYCNKKDDSKSSSVFIKVSSYLGFIKNVVFNKGYLVPRDNDINALSTNE